MNFDAKKETNKIIKFIQNHFKNNGLDGIVIGISGGKDSTIAAALFAKALGPENIIGINIPINSLKKDATDAERVADHLGFKLITTDLSEEFEKQEANINKVFALDKTIAKEAAINLKPRIRMSTLYYVAQAMSAKTGKLYVVAGTGNKCEIYVGYFTKFGDGGSDINILADLTVREVLAIGDYLELPNDLVHKPPADGLSGQTDEERLGFSYDEVEKVINGEIRHEKIERMHRLAAHKLNPIVIYKKAEN